MAQGDQYSLLVCGLDCSIESTSSLGWEASPVEHVQQATVKLPTCNITLSKYTSPDGDAVSPIHIHSSGFLFIHDAPYVRLEESIRCMHRYVKLLLSAGGASRRLWVVINTPDNANTLGDPGRPALLFEKELSKYREGFSWRVLETPIQHAYELVGQALVTWLRSPTGSELPAHPEQSEHLRFWNSFLRGRIAPWTHRDYLRAAYLTLLAPENEGLGLLEVAAGFATNLNNFKRRNSTIQLPPASRTLTVFWLYHVKLAISAIKVHEFLREGQTRPDQFKWIFDFVPELMDEKLPESYYSPDILKAEHAELFWMLPNLRELVEPPSRSDLQFRKRLVAEQREGDPDRLLRFAFAVVQRYLRPGETRRRSWFIDLAFTALQQQTIRLRMVKPSIPQYSVTQAYFYIQLVHAALSQLLAAGRPEFVRNMTYPLFKDIFRISPSIWTEYYSRKLWDSPQARAGFVPPDLRNLPDTIRATSSAVQTEDAFPDSNEPLRRLGLVPELPPLEVLHFYHSILVADVESIPSSLDPADVTTRAHLLKYIHSHIILPSASPSLTPDRTLLLSLARSHLPLLTWSSPLPASELPLLLNLSLLFHPSHPLNLNPDYTPPNLPRRPCPPPYTNPQTGRLVRHHNCPCHAALLLPYHAGPNAVSYPDEPPYDHLPQLRHECLCHLGEALDHDAFAALCAAIYVRQEEGEKARRGLIDARVREGWEWDKWIRREGGLVLAWDGLYKALGGEEWSRRRDLVREGMVEVLVQEGELRGGRSRAEGNEQLKQGEEEREDGSTLDGEDEGGHGAEKTEKGEGEEADWDVVSQDTLC